MKNPYPGLQRFSHDAMGSRCEIFITGQPAKYARQAATAAFDEADALERALSRFRPESDVSRINRLCSGQSTLIGHDTLVCLQTARRAYDRTGGAFDVTVGALLSCWRCGDGSPRTPGQEERHQARARVGMDLLVIDADRHSVATRTDGCLVDLGGIGKGFAVDRMASNLADWDIRSALIQFGQSSVLAMGSPPDEEAWEVGIRDPRTASNTLETILLKDRALSGSGVLLHGRHIIDPRSGQPPEGRLGAWSLAPSAASSDALSTAFMVMSVDQIQRCCSNFNELGAMLLMSDGGELLRFGRW